MADDSLAQEHLNETIVLLSMTTLVGILYILVIMLYCLSFRLSYAQLRDDRGKIKRRTVCTLVFQTVLLICATLDVIVQNRSAQVMYVDNRTQPGGPLGLSARQSAATLSKVWSIVNVGEDFLILSVLVWRVSVVWSGTRFVIPITIASVFFYLGTVGLTIAMEAIAWNPDSSHMTARHQGQVIVTTIVFSVSSSIFMTLTIIARLLFMRRKHIKLMGKSDVAGQYLGIASMLIESYALDTLWNIGLIISNGLKYAPTLNLFNNCLIQVDILTNFLVIYRVLAGRAWTRQTQDRLSTLRWGSNGAGTTTSGTVELRQTSILEERPPVMSFRDESA